MSHLLQIGVITRTTANMVAESLYANDIRKLQKAISEYMEKTISFYDVGARGFYHGLTLGLITLMDNHYRIKFNRESGDRRYDISLLPRESKYPGIIMEIKWKSGLNEDAIEALSKDALNQIDEKRYDLEFKDAGIGNVMKLGIAFSGKKVVIRTK